MSGLGPGLRAKGGAELSLEPCPPDEQAQSLGLPVDGMVAKVRISPGRSTQACLDVVKTDCSGCGKEGSPKAPTATPISCGMRSRFELVIFDCDGVLVDSEPIINQAHAQVLTVCGYPITEQDLVERFCGMSDAEMLGVIEREWGRALPAVPSGVWLELKVA